MVRASIYVRPARRQPDVTSLQVGLLYSAATGALHRRIIRR
jgi:hypothetical protein